MLCTEDCCKAALLEALPFSRINNVVKLHGGAQLAWPDVCKHKQVGVCGSAHSGPHSLLWLSHAQYQLFAAFTVFLMLEVKVSCISVSSNCKASPLAGDIPAAAEMLWPGFVYLELTSILEEGKEGTMMPRVTWKECWIFWGPS